MASIDPSLISDPEEQKWVVEISKILNHQLQTDIKPPSVSLFQVPETITTKKPEAYEPQQIGLGPIHHFHPRPYKKMEQKKLTVMRNLLQDYQIKDYKLTILNKVKNIVPIIRSCYDMFLQDDDEHLALIFAIDGLFLLNLLQTYNNIMLEQQRRPKVVGPKKRSVAQDILMVENQIPFMILKDIDDALRYSSSSNNLSPSILYRVFCKMHSPLKLCSESQAPCSADHLLHYMYQSIVNNDVREQKHEQKHDNRILETLEVVTFFKQIPHDEIVQVYEQTISILETFCQSHEPVIPSASNLHDKAGFRFHRLEEDEGGVKNVRVRGTDVYLPTVTLNKDSEIVLRNLVAYETLTANNSFPLTEFMILMCGLIVNVDDVKRLENVIDGELDANDVVKLFTGMSGCIPAAMKMEEMIRSNNVQVMVDEINRVYNSRLRMKPYLLLKKTAHWLLSVLRVVGSFVGSSWKIVAFMVSIVTVFFLTLQAYCDVYGCAK